MTEVLQDALSCVTATEPAVVGALHVYGLRWSPPASVDYVILSEAMEEGDLEVSEVSEAGSVPNLQVVDRGDHEVLLLAGEILVGAKQNRAINASMMIPLAAESSCP